MCAQHFEKEPGAIVKSYDSAIKRANKALEGKKPDSAKAAKITEKAEREKAKDEEALATRKAVYSTNKEELAAANEHELPAKLAEKAACEVVVKRKKAELSKTQKNLSNLETKGYKALTTEEQLELNAKADASIDECNAGGPEPTDQNHTPWSLPRLAAA